MFGLILGALWRRRAQAMLLFALAVVATTGAAAAPVYIVGSVQSLAAAGVDDAPNGQRIVAASVRRSSNGQPAELLATFHDQVVNELKLPGFTTTSGLGLTASYGQVSGRIDYRDGLCEHVVLDGACPSQAGEIVLQRTFANSLGVAVGGVVNARLDGLETTQPFRVVGIYQPVDPRDPFWGRTKQGATDPAERLGGSFAFTALPTFAVAGVPAVDLTVDLLATPEAFRQRDPQLHALAFEQGRARLSTEDVVVGSDLRVLADRIFNDQQLIYVGVAVGAGELLLMCWFALFLAVSQTAHARRGDVGLLKMRGARRRDIWRLLAGQSVLPLTAGGVVGFVAGPLLTMLFLGGVEGAEVQRAMWLAVAASTLFAVVGAVIAALIAERRMLSESVASLGRGVVGHRRTWRSGVFDALVVVVAAAAGYQVKAGPDTGGVGGRGVELVAPVLLTLAVGVLAARLIPVLAALIGKAALRAGRLSTGLTALHLARRPETTRVLGLVIVVVAVLCGTALTWSASDRARHDRAVFEVGDEHVLTVEARNPTALLAAVRKVDPDGQFAMAVVQGNTIGSVLAVDASRLGEVMPNLSAFGVDDWDAVSRVLRPATSPSVTVGPQPMSVDVSWSSASPLPVSLAVTVEQNDAGPTTVLFGPLRNGRHTYTTTVAPCSSACRLVSVALSTTVGLVAPDSVATVHTLAGLSDPGMLADRTRWRADVEQGAQVPRITTGPDGMTVTVTEATLVGAVRLNAAAYVLDAPTPLPVLVGGKLDLGSVSDPRARLTDDTVLPLQVVSRARMLPRVADGLLVDLEYAERLGRREAIGTMQVWLSANAPDDTVARLADAGVRLVLDESVPAQQDTLAAQGPPAALRFLLLVAFVGVLLAVIAFSVMAAIERRPRGMELAAMRRQGLRQGVVRRVAVGGYVVLIGVAVFTGAVAAAVLSVLFPPSLPIFGDGWAVLAPPGAPGYLLPAAAVAIALLLAAVAVAAAFGLAGAVKRRVAGPA